MVTFAFQQVGSAEVVRRSDYESLRTEIDRFVDSVGGRELPGVTKRNALDNNAIESLRSRVKGGLWEIVRGDSWSPELRSIKLATGSGGLEYDGDTADKFILSCLLLVSQTPGGLIAQCARKGCPRILLRQKRTTYCSRYCARLAEAVQARSRRLTSDPDQKRKQSEQRRARYEAWLAKHGYSKERIRVLHRLWVAKQKSQRKSEAR
jgi:hypothetical protein